MLPYRVSNPGPLTYESGALPIVLRGPAHTCVLSFLYTICYSRYHKNSVAQGSDFATVTC